MAERTPQIATARPKPTMALHLPIASGSRMPRARLTARAQRSRTASWGSEACFQRASGPTPMRKSAGAMSGTNTASKYGGPTQILPAPTASSTSGEIVPRETLPAAAASKRLFDHKKPSLEIVENETPQPMRAVRPADQAQAPPLDQ